MMKTSYHCTKCNYKFQRDKEVTKCPYCGATGSVEKSKTAQELLDALTEMDDTLQDTREEMKKYK